MIESFPRPLSPPHLLHQLPRNQDLSIRSGRTASLYIHFTDSLVSLFLSKNLYTSRYPTRTPIQPFNTHHTQHVSLPTLTHLTHTHLHSPFSLFPRISVSLFLHPRIPDDLERGPFSSCHETPPTFPFLHSLVSSATDAFSTLIYLTAKATRRIRRREGETTGRKEAGGEKTTSMTGRMRSLERWTS